MKREMLGFASLFYDNPLSSWIYELNTFKVLDVNDAALKESGFSKESYLSKKIIDSIIEKDIFINSHSVIQNVSGNIALGKFTFLTNSGEFLFKDLKGYKINFKDRECIVIIGQDYIQVENNPTDYQQMMDASLDVFCTIDENGKFVYVSEAAQRHWGYCPAKLVGTPFIDLVHEDDISKTNTIANSILEGKEIKIFTNRYIKKDGEIAFNSWSAIWNNASRLMYCVARDSREKEEQEQLLNQSELRFKALVQGGSDVISIVNREGVYTYISPTCETVLGMAPEEIIGKNSNDFIHPDDIEKNEAILQKITTEKKVIVEPFRFLNNKKEWRWIETVLTNMLDNPAVNGIVANSRDVTDKIEEQNKLKLFESVITNTKDAVLITEAEPFDEPGPKILFVNEAFTTMTGYTFEEAVGQTPRILQGPKSDRKELARLGRALRNWESCEITTINYNKAGEEFWVNFALSPVADHKGRYTHWVSIQRDVTEQRIQLIEKDLLAQISLNFNNKNDLLSAVKGLCKSVSVHGNFDLVEVWTSNLEKSEMKLVAHYTATAADQIFYDQNGAIDCVLFGEGLPGKVWSSGAQLLWNDIKNHNGFLRKEAAKRIGLNTMLGIPLLFDGEVIGVMLIGTKNKSNHLKNYSRIFKKLEQFIGSELSRKKLEMDLSHLFDAIPDILCLFDFTGKFLKINKAGCTLLGYSEEEILHHNFTDFVHPEDRESSVNEKVRLESGEAIFEFENRYLTKDGETIWLSWTSNSSIEEGIIYSVAKNITTEKKLRELIRQTNSLAKIGSWEFDLATDRLYWSGMVYNILEKDSTKYTPEIENVINFCRDDFKIIAQNNFMECLNDGKSFDFEIVLVTANKTEKWVRLIGNAEIVNGKHTRIFGSLQDINAIKDTENRLRSLSENLPGVIYQYTINTDGTDSITHILGATQELWGVTASEAAANINLLWDQIALGGELDKVKKTLNQSIETKSRWTCRFKIVLPDGRLKTHLGNGTPIFLADGSIVFNVIVLDITQQAKNEDLLEQTTETARIGSWELDLINKDVNSMYWSPMVRDILELDDHYLPTMTAGLEFYIGNNKEKVQKAVNDLITQGLAFDEEILIHTKKENVRWIRVIGNSETINNKRIKIYGSIQDINDKKIAEEKILLANERFEKVTEATNDVIWDWDIINHTFYRSKAIESFFGKNTAQSLDEINFWQDRFHPEDLPEIKSSLDKALADPLCSRWKLEYRIYNSDDSILYVIDQGIIIRDVDGKAIRMVGAMTNITDQKTMTIQLGELNKELQKYTQELEISNEELEQFAYVASHDLQEPLRMITSFMDLLQRKYGDKIDEKGREYIHFATDGAKRMKQIILDLLEYSRTNMPTEGTENVDLNEVISDFKQLRRKLITEKKAIITTDKLPIIKTHKAPITQVFHCLLDNAIKYTDENIIPKIEINIVENEKEWLFSISDNGIGIDAQFYDKIFIIFQRLHNKDKYSGTGIGLSIAKRHIEFLGGKIGLKAAEGAGTVFYFTIPKIH